MQRVLYILIAIAIVVLVCLPAKGVQVEGNTLTLTDEDLTACAAEGGCHYFITKERAMRMIEEQAKKRAGNCMGSSVHRPGLGDDT